MKRLNITLLVLTALWFSGFAALTARADIYSWTDENGVNHFTNYAPPKHAKLLIKTPEIPYDEEADNQRQEADRLEVARQELADREAFLLQEQQAAERRLAEANAKADAALREADEILREAETAAEDANYDRSNSYAYGYYPYYRHGYRSGYYHKGYYRKYGGSYYKKRPYKYRNGRQYKHRYRPSHKNRFNRRHTAFGRRGLSHQSRAAAFRGRHGRY
jgi:hypothetical protein